MKSSILIFSAVCLFAFTSPAYKVGDKVLNFKLKNALTNSVVSLTDFNSKKAVVIIFTSLSCPYSKIYDDRLINLAKEYEEKEVKFVFINSQTEEFEDQPDHMKKWAQEKNMLFLVDPAKEVARLFDATKSPEAFILKVMNGNFVLQYKGAIDDNPQAAKDVSAFYLKDAIGSILSDKAIKVSEKRATGCIIK